MTPNERRRPRPGAPPEHIERGEHSARRGGRASAVRAARADAIAQLLAAHGGLDLQPDGWWLTERGWTRAQLDAAADDLVADGRARLDVAHGRVHLRLVEDDAVNA